MTTPADIDRAMQQILDSHLDAHTRELVAAWAAGWQTVEARLTEVIAAGGDRARVDAAVDAMGVTLDDLATQAQSTIGQSVPQVVQLGVDGEARMAATALDGRVTVTRADDQAIQAIIQRATEQITAVTAPIGPEATAAVRRRLVGGVALGDNPREVARRIVADVDGDFNGGLARALNISRTEMLDAMRAGQKATDLANPGVITGWVWAAHLDSRTCRACVAMHGTEHDVDEDGPNDHHSGRCARIPRTASWAALGFKGIPEPDLGLADADAWIDGLDDTARASLLGKDGAAAYARGDYPRSAWVEDRKNTGWRDSIAPTKPPKGAA